MEGGEVPAFRCSTMRPEYAVRGISRARTETERVGLSRLRCVVNIRDSLRARIDRARTRAFSGLAFVDVRAADIWKPEQGGGARRSHRSVERCESGNRFYSFRKVIFFLSFE